MSKTIEVVSICYVCSNSTGVRSNSAGVKLVAGVYEKGIRRDMCSECYIRYYDVNVPEYIPKEQYVAYRMGKVIKEIREEREPLISEGE